MGAMVSHLQKVHIFQQSQFQQFLFRFFPDITCQKAKKLLIFYFNHHTIFIYVCARSADSMSNYLQLQFTCIQAVSFLQGSHWNSGRFCCLFQFFPCSRRIFPLRQIQASQFYWIQFFYSHLQYFLYTTDMILICMRYKNSINLRNPLILQIR